MRSLTLDTNCLYALEEAESTSHALRELISRCERGEIALLLPAISASERQRGGNLVETFAQFQGRVGRAGLGCARLIQPICYWDLTFWDFCLRADESMSRLERTIHDVLFPSVEFDYAVYCAARGVDPLAKPLDGRWRNVKCDVLTAWSHIHHGGHVLVTTDGNFRKKAEALERRVGAGRVLSPSDALDAATQ